MKSFASDNHSGVHPEILHALEDANNGHVPAYGEDPYTLRARHLFQTLFESEVEVFFVFTGTAANVLGLQALVQSYHSVLCAASAHIQVDECGAPEKFSGAKLIPIDTPDGKLSPSLIQPYLNHLHFVHHSQPRVISISQSTELGTVYTPDQIKALADLAHEQGLYLHMDGARIANAAVFLGCSLKEMVCETGVDLLSFGGTKNGMMCGEALVFTRPSLAENFGYIRKQGLQLASKMRFVSAQFIAYLEKEIWKSNAIVANRMAQRLSREVSALGIPLTQPTEANAVFAILPESIIPALQRESFFYVWDEKTSEVRWVCSWDTCEEDINRLIVSLRSKIRTL